jgi:small basic protein
VAHASTVAFVSGFNEIIMIAAILSFVGAALGFFLVRSSDFVQSVETRTR